MAKYPDFLFAYHDLRFLHNQVYYDYQIKTILLRYKIRGSQYLQTQKELV